MARLRLGVSSDEAELVLAGPGATIRRAALVPAELDRMRAFVGRYERVAHAHDAPALAELGADLTAWLAALGLDPRPSDPFEQLELEVHTPSSNTTVHRTLLDLPWELLTDGRQFLAEARGFSVSRRVGPAAVPLPAHVGRLSILFMAASPQGSPVLDFEGEEAEIRAVEPTVEIIVEETGTLTELGARARRLATARPTRLDVLHLSCHGSDLPEPRLRLEDAHGGAKDCSPVELVEALGDAAGQLRLVFISACATGLGGTWLPRAKPFALSLVEAGLSAVIAWAVPVDDRSATRQARVVYEALGRGVTVEHALGDARRALLSEGADPHWHLARLYLGRRGGGQLIAPDARSVRTHALHSVCLAGDVRILVATPAQFVGRRRLLQHCIRALRSPATALLLHGPRRVGKSSVAARIVDRMNEHVAVAMVGVVEPSALIESIHERYGESVTGWFGRWRGCSVNVLSAAIDELRLVDPRPLLLILDELEHALEPRAGRLHQLCAPMAATLDGLIGAFGFVDSLARLILISQFKFEIAAAHATEVVSVANLDPRDMAKWTKRARLSGAPAELTQACAEASHGNPALLAMLLNGAAQTPESYRHVFDRLARVEQGVAVDELLVERSITELTAVLSDDERRTFTRLLAFDIPIPLDVAQASVAAGPSDIERLVALGLASLMPDVAVPGSSAVFVNPLARALVPSRTLGELDRAEQRALVWSVVDALGQHCRELDDQPTYDGPAHLAHWLTERARDLGRWDIIARFARLALVHRARTNGLDDARAEAKALVAGLEGAGIVPSIELDFEVAMLHEFGDGELRRRCLERCLARSVGSAPARRVRILLELADVDIQHGELSRAEGYLNTAEELAVEDKLELQFALIASARADMAERCGDYDEAIELRREIELKIYERLGDLRAHAIVTGQIANIERTRGRPDLALERIRDEVIPAFNRVGDVRSRTMAQVEFAQLLADLGDIDQAQALLTEAAPVFEALGDHHCLAMTLDELANLHVLLGEHDEALSLWRERTLKTHQQLGDVESEAVVLGQMADILEDRGDYDEALEIRRARELPAYEVLGDVRRQAGVCHRIAELLMIRGEYDDASELLHERVIPVFEALGDARGHAYALSSLASLHETRDEFDEALRLLRDEVLPALAAAGDRRSWAISSGEVAAILMRRGEHAEAMKILVEDELPVHTELGDCHSRVAAEILLARCLTALGQHERALRLLRADTIPAVTELGDVRMSALASGELASTLEHLGHYDEAIEILREELPVYEELQAPRDLLVGRTNLALALFKRQRQTDGAEIVALLSSAMAEAQRLHLGMKGQLQQSIRTLIDEPGVFASIVPGLAELVDAVG